MTQYKKDKIKPIYFNSNDYHGNRFLSNEAMDAGYSDAKTAVSDYALIMQQGVGTMVREDAEATLVAAENILLQNLVRHYPESRNAVRDVLYASNSVGPEVNIAWSSLDRKWLFECLVEKDVVGHADSESALCDPESLRKELASRQDAPLRAFSTSVDSSESGNNTISGPDSESLTDIANETEDDGPLPPNPAADGIVGSLDHYFVPDHSHPEGISKPDNDSVALFVKTEKAALAAQEHLMTLLSASASKHMNIIQHDMKEVSLFLHARSSASPEGLEAVDLDKEDDPSSPSDTDNTNTMVSSTSPSDDDSVEAPGSTNSSSSSAEPSLPQLSVPGHIIERFEGMDIEEVKLHYEDLLVELQGAIERRNKLDKSAKRITERLMRFSSSTSSETAEGRISVPLQKRIAQNVDDHMIQLETKSIEGISVEIDEDDRLGSRNNEDGTLEDQLADIERSWGDWCEPEYVWSPSASESRGTNSINIQNRLEDDSMEDDEDNETLEEALERMDNDWSKWEED